MAIIALPNTLADGTIPTAAQFMANFNVLVNEVNGSLDNANVKASAGIVESKIAFDIAAGHSHDGSNSKKITTGSHFAWYIPGSLTVADAQGMQFIVPKAFTAQTLKVKCESGTGVIRIKSGANTLKDSIAVSSTVSEVSAFTIAALAEDELLVIDVTTATSLVGLSAVLSVE